MLEDKQKADNGADNGLNNQGASNVIAQALNHKDLQPKSSIQKSDYMMLWSDLYNDSRGERSLSTLSTGGLLRPRRNKACFYLETREGGGAKDWVPLPRAHIDLWDCSRKISKILKNEDSVILIPREKRFSGRLRSKVGAIWG